MVTNNKNHKNLKRNIKKTLASIILPVGLLVGGCSTSVGPLKTSARVSREALDSLTGLNSNPAVMEFYKKCERNLETEFEKKNARLENTRKKLLMYQLSDPYLSYSAHSSAIEEQKILEDFYGDVTGDAFRDTIEEDLFRPFELELETDLYNYLFNESDDEKPRGESKLHKAKSYLYELLGAKKIDFGVRPSFQSGKAGGRVYARAENFNLFTNFQEGKIELGTDKKEEYKIRTRLVKKINEDWDVSFNFKLGRITRDDLSLGFIRNYSDEKTIIRDGQKISNEQRRARLALFAGYNKYNDEYFGFSLLKEF